MDERLNRPPIGSMFRSLLVGVALLTALQVPLAQAAPPSTLLADLPKPVKGSLSTLFLGNAVGQTGLNGQLSGTPEALLLKLKDALSKAGYSEQPIRTTVGAWGFSATWAPPAGITVDGTPAGKTAVLVTQATALGPNRLNLNVRFEGI